MTLVLLHPLPLDGSIWDEELRSLGSPCVAPTLYDLGDTLEEWARGVLDLCDPGPLVLVGSSVGGSCALEVAAMAAGRVRLMVLIGTKPGVRRDPEFEKRAVRVLREEGVAGAWQKYWAPLFAPDASPDVVDRARRIAEARPAESLVRGTRAFHQRTDRAEFATTWRCPVVVVTGVHDTTPGASACAQLAASLRCGSLYTVEGSGHYVPMERSASLTSIVREAIRGLAQ